MVCIAFQLWTSGHNMHNSRACESHNWESCSIFALWSSQYNVSIANLIIQIDSVSCGLGKHKSCCSFVIDESLPQLLGCYNGGWYYTSELNLWLNQGFCHRNKIIHNNYILFQISTINVEWNLNIFHFNRFAQIGLFTLFYYLFLG
jgi:hypothetical protein